MSTRYLLNGAAVVAALAIAGPVFAQNAPVGPKPSGNNYIPPSAPATAPPPAAAAAPNSAAPPMHHAVRHASAMHAHHRYMAHKAALTGDTTAQLNREELARIQSGGPPTPPPAAPMAAPMMPPGPNPSGGNAEGLPGPNPGGAPPLTPYTVTPPQR
jgi:hypothetical protein